MNKTLYRFAGAFVVVLGLAYLGHHLFVRAEKVAHASAASPVPQASATQTNPALPIAATSPAANTRAYAIYPDRETDTALGLSYSSFSGDFMNGVTMTPLPPNSAGRAALRIKGQQGQALSFALNDARCSSPVHVVVHSIDNKQPIESGALTGTAPKFSVPFGKQWLPNMLVEMYMDDKAPNNYFCGITVNWG